MNRKEEALELLNDSLKQNPTFSEIKSLLLQVK